MSFYFLTVSFWVLRCFSLIPSKLIILAFSEKDHLSFILSQFSDETDMLGTPGLSDDIQVEKALWCASATVLCCEADRLHMNYRKTEIVQVLAESRLWIDRTYNCKSSHPTASFLKLVIWFYKMVTSLRWKQRLNDLGSWSLVCHGPLQQSGKTLEKGILKIMLHGITKENNYTKIKM